MSDSSCPALVDLFATPPVPATEDHVGRCPRCRALLANIDTRLEPASAPHDLSEEPRVPATPGSLVLVSDVCCEQLLPVIVLAESEDGLTVVPVSPDVAYATEWDLYLPDVLLGYPAVAQVWNQGVVLPEQTSEHITDVPPVTLDALKTLVRAANASVEVPAGLTVGSPVFTDLDPRLLHQDMESRRALSFWEPTLTLAGSLTLGQLIRHRRDELQVPVREIEQLAERVGWLAELEADTLDLPRAVPPGALAATMRVLRVAASRRLEQLARWTIEAQSAGTGAALGRRASGESDDPADVDAYIGEFMRDLGGGGS
jgi:hypothetical protein